MNRTSRRLLLLALPLALAATACGSGGRQRRVRHHGGTAGAAEPTEAADHRRRPRRRPTTATADDRRAGEPASTRFGDVQPAVVQIVAQGTFRDPEVGFADGSGLGSGFIISPDGLAVTNNHVVAGAATLEVYIGGELDESYNATILGVSECNDLALIDINGPDDLPYLEWYDGEIERRPRRLRRRLPARRPRVHADPGHRRQGRGRRRPHRHVVDRPHHRARRQHPARQLRRPAGRRRRQGRRRQLRRRGDGDHDGAVLRHRLGPRPAGHRRAADR